MLGHMLISLEVPWQSDWLYNIGVFFMILNLLLFVLNCIMITLRFSFYPGSFHASFTSQSESLFIPASVSSLL